MEGEIAQLHAALDKARAESTAQQPPMQPPAQSEVCAACVTVEPRHIPLSNALACNAAGAARVGV